jgi:hypothetical protein
MGKGFSYEGFSPRAPKKFQRRKFFGGGMHLPSG